MSITVLSDVIAPNSLWSAGVRGKQMRVNARAQNQGGHQQINIVRARTVRQYEFGTVPMLPQIWQTLEGLHEVTEGGAYGFLVQDPKDASAGYDTGRVTLLDAGTHTYQLWKQYTSAGSTRTTLRKITRVRQAGFTLRLSGTPSLSFTLDPDTGIITIPSDPLAAAVTWAGLFYVPVHFEEDDIDWDLNIAGPADSRRMSGPRITFTEILE